MYIVCQKSYYDLNLLHLRAMDFNLINAEKLVEIKSLCGCASELLSAFSVKITSTSSPDLYRGWIL